MKKLKVYFASGWWTKNQIETYEKVHKIFDRFKDSIDVFYPKEKFEIKSGMNLSEEQLDLVFYDNILEISKSDLVVVSTEDKDLGSLFESGVAFSKHKKIIYVNFHLPPGAKINLMLARSGASVTNEKELIDILNCFVKLNSYFNINYQNVE